MNLNVYLEQLGKESLIELSYPWSGVDEEPVYDLVREVVKILEGELGLTVKCRYETGCGGASFVEIFLYRETSDFGKSGLRESYSGLLVWLCQYCSIVAMGEGYKHWDTKSQCGSSSGLGYDNVDLFSNPCIAALARPVQVILTRFGWERIHQAELRELLPKHWNIETDISSPPYRLFDLLFNETS